jgi:hypothetical protein
LLGGGGERRGEEAEGDDYCERSAYDDHAATAVCWLNTLRPRFRPFLRRLRQRLPRRIKAGLKHAPSDDLMS